MEIADRTLTALDRLYLARAYELAQRGAGSTAPNPPVGAVIVAGEEIVGEGYHHRAGGAHAEINALEMAGSAARGATVYMSLEPCGHAGRTPPCTDALVAAGVARVVAGTADPAGHGGAPKLRERDIQIVIGDDAVARDLIEPFAVAMRAQRPYLALKMAMSLDGFVAGRPGTREPLSSVAEQRLVHEFRAAYDAVLVGAGTVRVDDPALTVRPTHHRLRPYQRIVMAQTQPIPAKSRIFSAAEEYATTIVLAPEASRAVYRELESVADVLYIDGDDGTLDLRAALQPLRAREICSVLCEGGPRLASALIAAGVVDRVYWAIAPRLLANETAVPVLSGCDLATLPANLRFDRVERLGEDVLLSGALHV
ncbi:MAG: bifunctional diaminohydroxyphosphoribosylaminopyrimidine deaminase/5-amino-6-(5-phosphoribosylamino)uracil reductase RibD [Candidatus Eremiobacteraeota bacterium]|nr:bifunctional diaminohydroxyphosphoribosylaminopyrimidine deaminase/5-amino-6-(5-phosphoribosylamino)uracil reductase RibD [Candidatus Eremiobacteraeota bacterium]